MNQQFFNIPTSQLRQFVERQRLGLVTSRSVSITGEAVESSLVTPLPLLITADTQDNITEFFGHFARSNPQVAALQQFPEATIIFQGPHSYVPTDWVSQPKWAPTWNYAMAHFDVSIQLLPQENEQSILELVAALENRWTVAKMGERYAGMLPHIIAFRAVVRQAHVKFKLGQDETEQTFNEILEHLKDTELARLMQETRHAK